MGTPPGTAPHSLPTLYPNMDWRGMAAALTRVDTTASVLITPPVDMMVSPAESPSNPQYPPLQPLTCGVYPLPATFILTLSGCVTHYG